MSSDRRWTGGSANRQWQRGTQAKPPVDVGALTKKVTEYLKDCRRFASLLRPADHPTEKGALMMIYHRDDDEKAAIQEAFRRATETATAVSRG